MTTSFKSDEMLLTVSPIYPQNKTMKAIFEAIGSEAKLSEDQAEDVAKQLFVQTATWGLVFWEGAVGIPLNKSKTLKERRSAILAKMQTRYPVTPNRIKRIIESMTGEVVDIIQNVADYTFLISFASAKTIDINFLDTLNEVKPAHLSYRIESRIERVIKILTNIDSGLSLFPLCNTLETGEWPYQQNVGKLIESKVIVKPTNTGDFVKYNEVATVEASEELYKEHLFATQATHKSNIKPQLSYYEREVGYIETNEVVSGEYPYAVVEGKVVDTGSVIKSKIVEGKSKYPETALVVTSEDLHAEYAFAEMTDFEFGLTANHHVSLKELEYKKSGELISGDYPYAKESMKKKESQVTKEKSSRIGKSAYRLCGETRVKEE